MQKKDRKKGEKYLEKWADAILDMENMQMEINRIKKGVCNDRIENNIIVQEKNEIIDCYNTILEEKKEKLKNIIRNYKFVDDIINNIEYHQRKVIESRYKDKKHWGEVALEAHISLRQCFNIKNRVIKEILEQEKCQEQNLYSF